MTTSLSATPQTALKKHDRSDALQHARRLQPTGERPAWLGPRASLQPTKAELAWLSGLRDPAALEGLALPWWQMALPAMRNLVGSWITRSRTRRDLTQIDARTLRDAGISPGAAAFEAAQPFWQAPVALRDHPDNTNAAA